MSTGGRACGVARWSVGVGVHRAVGVVTAGDGDGDPGGVPPLHGGHLEGLRPVPAAHHEGADARLNGPELEIRHRR